MTRVLSPKFTGCFSPLICVFNDMMRKKPRLHSPKKIWRIHNLATTLRYNETIYYKSTMVVAYKLFGAYVMSLLCSSL
jgi:hypothetical protein